VKPVDEAAHGGAGAPIGATTPHALHRHVRGFRGFTSGLTSGLWIIRKFGFSSFPPASWIRIGFTADPDPAFYLNADSDPGSKTNAAPDTGQTLKSQNVELLHEKYL
jgi:hypothetical protein